MTRGTDGCDCAGAVGAGDAGGAGCEGVFSLVRWGGGWMSAKGVIEVGRGRSEGRKEKGRRDWRDSGGGEEGGGG